MVHNKRMIQNRINSNHLLFIYELTHILNTNYNILLSDVDLQQKKDYL